MSTTTTVATATEEPEFYKVIEAANRLRCSRALLYRLMNSGQLAYITIGDSRTRRIPVESVDELIEQWKRS